VNYFHLCATLQEGGDVSGFPYCEGRRLLERLYAEGAAAAAAAAATAVVGRVRGRVRGRAGGRGTGNGNRNMGGIGTTQSLWPNLQAVNTGSGEVLMREGTRVMMLRVAAERVMRTERGDGVDDGMARQSRDISLFDAREVEWDTD
jgi:hypothetical protein